MCKAFAGIVLMMVLISMFSMTVFAATAHENWRAVADEMGGVLDEAYDTYVSGDVKGAKDQVNFAYFGYYEKLGFEKTVMGYISGDRATQVEYQFSMIKKAMTAGAPNSEIRDALDVLDQYLQEDAKQLDGEEESSVAVFFASLMIIMRDGFEAILILGAIIAYLIKSGNKQKIHVVYTGTFIAIGASIALAFVLIAILNASGAQQELIEGITVLIAVAVLFYVSNWMISKTQASAWNKYIEGQVQGSVARGGIFSLAFAAFLAVFREGAELILFYYALFAGGGTQSYINMVWLGLGVGCVLLVVVYLLIRYVSIKLPVKQFFFGTSILLSLMAIAFIGSGIKKLQSSNIISVTPIQGFPTVDVIYIYPTVETLIPQVLLLSAIILTFVLQINKMRKAQKEPKTAK